MANAGIVGNLTIRTANTIQQVLKKNIVDYLT
jgi:hypothetical protein